MKDVIKLKPGQLVKYNHPANPTLGLVKSVKDARNRVPAVALIRWCNDRNTEEYVWQKDLKLVEEV